MDFSSTTQVSWPSMDINVQRVPLNPSIRSTKSNKENPVNKIPKNPPRSTSNPVKSKKRNSIWYFFSFSSLHVIGVFFGAAHSYDDHDSAVGGSTTIPKRPAGVSHEGVEIGVKDDGSQRSSLQL
ncbi:unnamed protein product, partial [Prunus brigantina]